MEGLCIQGLSQHVGINLGRSEFFNTMQGAPFLPAANPFVFTLQNDCYRQEVLGFNSDAAIYGCGQAQPQHARISRSRQNYSNASPPANPLRLVLRTQSRST